MGQLSFFQFIAFQWRLLPDPATFNADLSGKTVVVTGGNIGLGFEAAKHLARMGPAKLIIACRDESKGTTAAQSIVEDTRCKTLECWNLDIASFESVKAFAARFEQEGGGKLDILIENAGVTLNKWTDVEGWETTLKVNHLGTAHLGLRLLPYLLKASAANVPPNPAPRVIVVSSEMHYWTLDEPAFTAPNMLETLNDKARYDADSSVRSNRYGTTKLFNVLFAQSLSTRLPPSSHLTALSVNPGLCHSSIMRSIDTPFLRVLRALLARTAEVGSRTLVHAAVGAELEGQGGAFVSSCEVHEPSDWAVGEKGERLEKKLWDETLAVLFKADPELRGVLEQCGVRL